MKLRTGGYGIVTGYRVVTVDIDTSDNSISSLENFVYGFRAENQSCGVCGGVYDGTGTNVAWARPGFIEILYDGSVLISDDTGHYVFRVQYDGSDAMDYECPTNAPTAPSKAPTANPSSSPITGSPTSSPITMSPTEPTAAPVEVNEPNMGSINGSSWSVYVVLISMAYLAIVE